MNSFRLIFLNLFIVFQLLYLITTSAELYRPVYLNIYRLQSIVKTSKLMALFHKTLVKFNLPVYHTSVKLGKLVEIADNLSIKDRNDLRVRYAKIGWENEDPLEFQFVGKVKSGIIMYEGPIKQKFQCWTKFSDWHIRSVLEKTRNFEYDMIHWNCHDFSKWFVGKLCKVTPANLPSNEFNAPKKLNRLAQLARSIYREQ